MDAILPDPGGIVAFLVLVDRDVLEGYGKQIGEDARYGNTPDFPSPALGEDWEYAEFSGETTESGGKYVVMGLEICYHGVVSSFLLVFCSENSIQHLGAYIYIKQAIIAFL
ncbi:hypothetical protein SDC9_94392 [bioreactor metagenome]|uniref:Uncharacterized protein n=1 Tax=bioreactor metagenome TaxID=1076179 RepID=A0A645A3B8_9ZZZZ